MCCIALPGRAGGARCSGWFQRAPHRPRPSPAVLSPIERRVVGILWRDAPWPRRQTGAKRSPTAGRARARLSDVSEKRSDFGHVPKGTRGPRSAAPAGAARPNTAAASESLEKGSASGARRLTFAGREPLTTIIFVPSRISPPPRTPYLVALQARRGQGASRRILGIFSRFGRSRGVQVRTSYMYPHFYRTCPKSPRLRTC